MTISADAHSVSERTSTDDSLRAERNAADQTLERRLAQLEDATNAVIEKARARADAALSVSRGRQDRGSIVPGVAQTVEALARERVLEDRAIRTDRDHADASLHANLQGTLDGVSRERAETDRDLDLERAEVDAAVATRDQFLAIVSHDLRSMLHAILGHAELIGMEAQRENRADHVLPLVECVARAGARMNRLIGDLIDVGCIEAGTLALAPEEGTAVDVLTEAVLTLEAQAEIRGISLRSQIVASAASRFDSARILQVLINLISNAIKFTAAGGTILARLEHIENELVFSVTDSGIGIPRDKLEIVFERYRQIDRHDSRGVGLGLYISKNIVEAHRGRIWVESKLGSGSTFFFTLPSGPRQCGKPENAALPVPASERDRGGPGSGSSFPR